VKGIKRRYRSRIQIAADILEIARNGARKTRIMYMGNLSFDLFQRYLDLLTNFGLIEIKNGNKRTYAATEKGRQFLEDYHELRKYSDIVEMKKRVLERRLSATA